MAQFDVHHNPGQRRAEVPYVVVVQSALFDGFRRRVVVPLVRADAMPAAITRAESRMNPAFHIDGERLLLHPLEMVSMDRAALGNKVASLADQGQAITDALDEIFTRTWG